MKKASKEKLIKGSIVGALGAAAVGGAAYLLSNKKARQKIGKAIKSLEKRGGEELEKVLDSVKNAKEVSEKKVKKTLKQINLKKDSLT